LFDKSVSIGDEEASPLLKPAAFFVGAVACLRMIACLNKMNLVSFGRIRFIKYCVLSAELHGNILWLDWRQ
jgi:hypothetical protein